MTRDWRHLNSSGQITVLSVLHDKVSSIQDTGYRIQDTSDQDLQIILEVSRQDGLKVLSNGTGGGV